MAHITAEYSLYSEDLPCPVVLFYEGFVFKNVLLPLMEEDRGEATPWRTKSRKDDGG